MRGGDAGTGVRSSRVQRHDRDAQSGGPDQGRAEAPRVTHALEEHADGTHPVVVEQRFEAVLDPDVGLIADRDHVTEPQAALLEREVQPDVAALGDDRHAAIDSPATVLVGPECDAVERVHVAVAVRPEEGHPAGGADEGALQGRAVVTGLGEPRPVADGTTGARCGETRHCRHRGMAVDTEEHRVRDTGQRIEG